MSLRIRENVPLAPLTTFEIGGPARYFTEVRDDDGLREALQWARERSLKHAILAGGSNVLVSDEGFDGLIIHLISAEVRPLYEDSQRSDLCIVADAGCHLLALIRAGAQDDLGGWEKLAGIPGSVGGAVRGNAGAFGSEIKDFVVKAGALHVETGEIREFTNEECDFSYRRSFFKDHPEWIVIRAKLQLAPTKREKSQKLIDETIAEREKRHLQNVKAAGSFFMNPVAPQNVIDMFESEKGVQSKESRVPAGWLIEKVGMKGATVGGAIASLQHPNYLVNMGSATAQDVKALAIQIKEKVLNDFLVSLTEEAVII